MNILVVTMSLIDPRIFQEEKYLVDGEDAVKGCFTNEAPCKYLTRKLYHQAYTFFDRVIVLATKECREQVIESADPVINGRTTTAYFEQMLLSYMEKMNPDQFQLYFPTKNERKDIFRYVSVSLDEESQTELLEAYTQNVENPWDANVYLDFTGGYRPENLAGLMVSRCLDAAGYQIRSVVYSYYSRNKTEPNRICDISGIYNMFDAIIAQNKLRSRDFTGVHEDALLTLKERGISIDFGEYGGSEQDFRNYARAYNGKEPYIFVSYAHKDMLFTQSFIKNMERRGITRIWYDEGITPSEYWETMIKDKVEHCSLFVMLVSATYNNRPWCQKELLLARSIPGLRMLVISMDGTMPSDETLRLDKEQAIMAQKYLREEFFDKVLQTPGMDLFREQSI